MATHARGPKGIDETEIRLRYHAKTDPWRLRAMRLGKEWGWGNLLVGMSPFVQKRFLLNGGTQEQLEKLVTEAKRIVGLIENGQHLTPEEEAIGLALGILDDTDFAGSVANEGEDESWFEEHTRTRKPSNNEAPDLTKSELVRKAIKQGQKCWVHGGSLVGYYQRGNRGIIELKGRIVQFHYPSKAAAKDAGFLLTKAHIHAACKVCNDLMTDAFGVSTPEEEMRRILMRKAAGRKIEFLEPDEVAAKEEWVKQTIYTRVSGSIRP
jgi:hypothetical protein